MLSYKDVFQDELQTKSKNVIKTFCSGFISVDSPEHDIIVFDSPVINQKKCSVAEKF